jgi:aminoglycoside/choline kinase family phosphotransferase
MGRQEYDLASLLYDPYMNHSLEDRRKLLELWEEICEEEPIQPILKDCASQRLMQALGAFSNIGHNENDEWYLAQIPAAVGFLKEVIDDTPLEDALGPFLD